jgi:hypothetical protein
MHCQKLTQKMILANYLVVYIEKLINEIFITQMVINGYYSLNIIRSHYYTKKIKKYKKLMNILYIYKYIQVY